MKRGISGILATALGLAMFALVPGVRAQEEVEPMTREPALRAYGLLAGSGAYLGVRIEDVDEARAEEAGLDSEYGVYLEEVTEDGPAAGAGLEAGDVLVAWNDERLESVAQLQRLVRETPAGREVALTAVRAGREREVTIVLGDRAEAMGNLRVFTVPREREVLRNRLREGLERTRPGAGVRLGVFGARPRLGVSVQSLSDQLAQYFEVEGGMLVFSVSEDSPAEAAGIRAGDVIVEVDGEAVDDHGDIGRALGDREAGPVDVVVVRDGQRRTLTVDLEEGDIGRGGSGGVYWYGDGTGMWIDGIRTEPFRFDGVEVGPIELDAFDLDIPAIDLDIPSIEIPRIDVPPIELPRLLIPRVRVVETTI